MRTPPNRVAVVALVLLVLACIGVWLWMRPRVSLQPAGNSTEVTGPLARGTHDKTNPAGKGMESGVRSKAAELCGEAMNAALSRHVLSLKTRDDANSQVSYALSLPFAVYSEMHKLGSAELARKEFERRMEWQRSESRQAFARAKTLAPDDAGIVWLAATHCGGGAECVEAQQALLRAEPNNAAAWLMEMGWARMRDDKLAYERAFDRASASTAYDRHAGANLLAMLDSFAEVPMPRECKVPGVQSELRRDFPGEGAVDVADFVQVWAVATTQFPAYGGLTKSCKPAADAKPDTARFAGCRRILEMLAAGDSMLEQSIALALLVELAGDGPDAGRWRQRYRELQWMQAQMVDMATQRPQTATALHSLTMEDYIFDEMRAMQAALQVAGRWPPPADWLPSNEGARSLILTGRPPESSR